MPTSGRSDHAGPNEPSDEFAVRCVCGFQTEGARESSYQRLRCLGCGGELFVLPSNPRPRPAAPTAAESAQVATPSIRPPLVDEIQRPGLSAELREWFGRRCARAGATLWANRRRLGIVLFVVAIGSTLALAWHLRRQDALAALLDTSTREGRQALRQGDYPAAVAMLREADRAARGLRGDTPAQRTARQLYRESLIWSNLCLTPLGELPGLLQKAERVDDAQAEFERRFAGRAIVIETRVSREEIWLDAPDDEGEPPEVPLAPLSAECQFWGAGVGVRIQLADDHPAFAWLAPGESAPALFGAELRGLRRVSEEPALWEIELVSDSLVLLTEPEPFTLLRWPDVETLIEQLDEQRARLAVSR